MRDVGPQAAVVVVEGEGRPQAFDLGPVPDLAEIVGGELALEPGVVHSHLVFMHGDLAHHRVQHVLDLGGQQIGRAPWSESVCQYGETWVVAVSLKKNKKYEK